MRLTQDPAIDTNPTWSPDGSSIAFVRYADATAGIFTVPALGGMPRKIHEVASAIQGMDWSPQGDQLVYSARSANETPYRLVVLDIVSGEVRDLTAPPPASHDIFPAISPDGARVAFMRRQLTGRNDLYMLPLAGGTEHQLTEAIYLVRGVAWRADGRELIFACAPTGPAALWGYSLATGTLRPLIVRDEWVGGPTTPRQGSGLVYETWHCRSDIYEISLREGESPRALPAARIASTRWDGDARVSPDGEHIVFTSARRGTADIWVCRRDGSGLLRLTSLGGYWVGDGRWSADGREIAFSASPEGYAAVHRMAADGGGIVRLSYGEHNDQVCDWSRDGTRIYFASDRTGSWQIWSMHPDGSAAKQLTEIGGIEAFESSDGAWIYFLRSPERGIWRIPVAGGTAESVHPTMSRANRGNWCEHGGYLYAFTRVDDQTLIVRYDSTTQETETLIGVPGFGGPGIALTPDGSAILYARTLEMGTDLRLVADFR